MRGIRVRGVGRVGRAPDSATATAGVQIEAGTARQAQADASERMQAVLAAIAEAGVAARDVRTQRVSLEQTFDHAGSTPRATGYQATQMVAMRIRDLSRLGPVIDAAVEAGANRVSEIVLELSDPVSAHAEARQLAMSDARRTAEALALAGGVRLGLPIAIREDDTGGYPPGPMFRAKTSMALAAPTPIAAGETDIELTVEVTWAILG